MFEKIAQKWAVNDHLPKKADLIVVISYGAAPNRLTNMSLGVVMLAKQIAGKYPNALIAWGSFSGNENELEKIRKLELFPGSIYVGPVSSSTEECQAVRKAVAGKSIKNIIVVADGSHSRRCKRVWKYFFSDAEICFRSTEAWWGGDKENPMWLQRNWRVWLLANISADLLYHFKPTLRWLIKRNFSQPTV